MDGLLLDTERPFNDLWLLAARNRGWSLSADVVLRTIGVDEASTRCIITEEYGQDFPYGEILADLRRLYREMVDREGIAWRPGLPVILDKLERLAIPFGLATSSTRKSALWKLERAGLVPERFAASVCGDEVERGKPAPDIFLRAAKLLRAAPRDCLGLEDSPAGLKALAAAGIPSIFIKDLQEPSAEILAAVWHRCENLAEAATLIG